MPSSNPQRNCLRTPTEISSLIKELRNRGDIFYSGPHKAEEIDAIEQQYTIKLPSDYRQFLTNYGLVAGPDIEILGLSDPKFDLLGLEVALQAFRLADMEVPIELCPIEFLPDKSFVCLVCDPNERVPYTPVVVFKLQSPQPILDLPVLARCFRDYLHSRLTRIKQGLEPVEEAEETSDNSWEILEQHVQTYHQKFEYDHAKGGKLPRNTDWRPYRYCIQDVMFGATVVRHHQEGNCLQVDVFLTADVPEYGPLAGARALTAFLLSEAYKCGGTMELRFTRNVEGGQVPAELQELAVQYGVRLTQAAQGRINPGESKALYAAMTGFSERLQAHINQLESEGKMKMARACYVVHHGVWSKEQLEMIVLGSENPESILSGQARPEQRHLYHHDLLHARAALMAGMFERIILQRNRVNEEGVAFDMEDDLRELQIRFDGTGYVKEYLCSEPVALPWLFDTKNDRTIPENINFQVLVRARSQADLRFHFPADIQTAAKWKTEKNAPTFILVPRDFTEMPGSWMAQVAEKADQAGIGILVCPESVAVFDVEAAQRLSTSRVLRQ